MKDTTPTARVAGSSPSEPPALPGAARPRGSDGTRGSRWRSGTVTLAALGVGLSLAAVAGPAAAAVRAPLTRDAADTAAMATSKVGVKVEKVAKYGKILVDQKGLPLYYDTANKPPSHWACKGGCLAAWPPFVLTGSQKTVEMGAGVTGITILMGPSGRQVAWKGKPLYTYITDSPGNVGGQGLGHVWYVVQLSGAGRSAPTTMKSVGGY
jgi:predicted lipoprotein with Yx(FWY)xxD motif